MMALLREPESSFPTNSIFQGLVPTKCTGESKEDGDLLWMYNAVILGNGG